MASETIKGILAVFDHPDVILDAAKKTRDQGYVKWDVFTPFPVHGMDDAMGLGRSKVPFITFFAGAVGLATALFIQFGTMVVSWPQNYGGKPFNSWPSFVPISFEMTVLFAGLATAFGSLLIGGVFKLKKPVLDPSITCDRFAIYIEAADPKFDAVKSKKHLESLGALEVKMVKEPA